jgi:hypothetical protein
MAYWLELETFRLSANQLPTNSHNTARTRRLIRLTVVF